MSKETLEIKLSKKKMLLTFLGSCIFVFIGFWYFLIPSTNGFSELNSNIFLMIIGLLCIVFFGLVAATVLIKIFDSKAGLVIDNEGILDNSSGVSAGFVPWKDIEEIKLLQIGSQNILMIIVKDPKKYFENVNNPIKKMMMKMNYKSYGSPISISSHSLKINFNQLQQILIDKLLKYRY